MKRGPTGHYEVSVGGEERVRAFVPDALPPTPPIELDAARSQLHEGALLACGRLDGLTSLLPDPRLFLYSYVRREAVLSSQIEGTQSSLSDLMLFELAEAPGAPLDDVIEVSNYVAALERGLELLRDESPLTNRLLREVHATLLSRGRGSERQPGEFRRSQNWIGGTRPGNAVFVPPPPHLVAACMADLEKYLNREEAPHGALITAILAHAQFETIHPFLDGNGRLGRLLIALILRKRRVLHQPLLCLSLFLKRHRAEYYRLLDMVRSDGDWEAWLDFFLEGVLDTANSAVETGRRLIELFESDEARVRGTGRSAANALRVYSVLRSRPLATVGGLAERAGISYPTAARAVESLCGLKILREVTGRSRDRVFAHDAYLAILNEGTEPRE